MATLQPMQPMEQQFRQQLDMHEVQLHAAEATAATLAAALDAVRNDAAQAYRDLREALSAEERKTDALQQRLDRGDGGNRKKWSLVSSKEFSGGRFSGARGENFRSWAKLAKVYCNAQQSGFRKAIEHIEAQEDEPVGIRALQELRWEHAQDANVKLSDFLQVVTSDDALRIVERYPEQGFEAWRQFKKRYNPSSGAFELERVTAMMARKQVKNLEDLPAAIDVFEKDMKLYEATMGVEFPKEMRLPMLLKLMPDAYREDLQRKYAVGQRDFAKICEDILCHATEHCVDHVRPARHGSRRLVPAKHCKRVHDRRVDRIHGRSGEPARGGQLHGPEGQGQGQRQAG